MLTASERLEALMLQDRLMQSHGDVLSEAMDMWVRILRYREESKSGSFYTSQIISRMIDVLLLRMESLPIHFFQRQLLFELWREQYEASK